MCFLFRIKWQITYKNIVWNFAVIGQVKDLSAEYAEVLADKKAAYAQYRNARTEMQDYLKAQKNVEQFLNQTRQEAEKAQEEKRKEETQR